MFLDNLINSLFDSIDKYFIVYSMILSDLNVEFYTMPIEPVTDMNVVIDAKLIAPY